MVDFYNRIEILLWASMGAISLLPKFQTAFRYWSFNLPLAVAFFLFAYSDYLEIQTGSWYQPWWLAALKVGCSGFIGWFFFRLFRQQRKGKR